MLNVTLKYKQAEQVCTTIIEEKVMMLEIESGEYYSLADASRTIWEMLPNEKSIQEIVSELVLSHDVTEEQCLHDTCLLVNELVQANLIHAVQSAT